MHIYHRSPRFTGVHTCTPKVFNREELQYGAYEMSVGDYWWGDDGGEVSECDEVLE